MSELPFLNQSENKGLFFYARLDDAANGSPSDIWESIDNNGAVMESVAGAENIALIRLAKNAGATVARRLYAELNLLQVPVAKWPETLLVQAQL